MITQHVCPWCGEIVAEVDSDAERRDFVGRYGAGAVLVGDYHRFRQDQIGVLEEAVASHLVGRHPVRRRLSRRTRVALRTSRVEA